MIVINVMEIYKIKDFDYSVETFNVNEDKIVYNKDGSFNRVRIEENIFVNISKTKMVKEVKFLLKQLIGKYFVIKESGQKVYIGKDFPGEFVYSKYTLTLNYRDKIVKFRVVNNLDSLIKNANSKKWTKNYKNKHNNDAKYGFYKYKIVFSIVYEGIETIYEGILLIRNDADGKKYLYDILNIKEKIDYTSSVASNYNKFSQKWREC